MTVYISLTLPRKVRPISPRWTENPWQFTSPTRSAPLLKRTRCKHFYVSVHSWNEKKLKVESMKLEQELKDYKWEDRYEWINIKKSTATAEYKAKNLESALSNYITGLLAIKYDDSVEHTDKINSKLRLDLLNNIIATLLELDLSAQAVVVCNCALALYPENAKLLARRSKAYIKQKKYADAMYNLSMTRI